MTSRRLGSLKWFPETVIAEKCFERAASVFQFCAETAEFEIEKIVRGVLQRLIVVIPPGFFAGRQTIHIDVFRLYHFEESGTAVGAAPAAGVIASVRRFGDSEVADRVV